MAKMKYLIGLLFLIVIFNFIECKGGRGGGSRGGGSRGRSSGSHSYGSHSYGSHSNSKPSSSWSSSSSSRSSHSYPSSSTGLSGSGNSKPSSSWWPWGGSSSSSSSGSSHSYPSSSTGLSGSSNSKPSSSWWPSGGSSSSSSSGSSHSYPSSSTGLSGSGNSKPSSSWWPSGGSSSSSSSGSSHTYPSSSTGLSGSSNSKPSSSWWSWGGSSSSSSSGSSHSYPSSSTGLSGSGHSSSGSSQGYPSSSTGLSGNNYRYPSRTGSGGHYYNQQPYGQSYNVPTYYSMPQHVYVTQYRDSGSSYSDLLTGLTLYNLGRSHSHHHEHYYNDDYYNRRYTSSSSYSNNNYNSYSKPQDTAVCRLKIKDHGSAETLKIPCEIVSTFTDETKKIKAVNTTVCVTKTTYVNSTTPSPRVMVGQNTTDSTYSSSIKMRSNSTESPEVTMLVEPLKTNATNTTSLKNNTESVLYLESDDSNMQHAKNNVSLMNTTAPCNQETVTLTIVNVVTCTDGAVNATDPLTVKGPTVDPSGKECIVEIQTKESLFSDKIDCSTLMKYAKMPRPREDESKLMPSRGQLKSWLSNPPWWMSAFIAV